MALAVKTAKTTSRGHFLSCREVDDIKDKQQHQREESASQAQELKKTLKDLETSINSARSRSSTWKEIWSEIKNINNLFKQIRFDSKATRENLWGRFQDLIDQTKEFQAEEQRENDKRSYKSEQYRNEIIKRAEASRPLTDFENTVADMVLLIPRIVTEIATLGLLKTQVDERKSELQACSQNLKEAWGLFNEYKQEMLGRDKHEAFQKLENVQEALNAAWDAWRQLQGQYHSASQTAWQERVGSNIDKLESRLENLYGILARREGHLSELEEKRDSAWNDDFRDRVRGWIDEEERRIEEIKSQISEVQGWLSEERRKL